MFDTYARPGAVRRLTNATLAVLLCVVAATPAAAQGIPARLADTTFWRMIDEFSEPGGYFRSDNLVSNEAAFQYVIPGLLKTLHPDGVYLGVGPDQNFTYLVAFQPRLAFIVDIRRGALQQHLMYKALIEMSSSRADFLANLFARKRPGGLDSTSSAQALFQAFAAVPPDSAMYVRTLAGIKHLLVDVHGFALGRDDLTGIDYVYGAFYAGGPDLTYNFGTGNRGSGGFGGFGMPSYAQLQMENDGQGNNRAYLGSEANYRILKDLEARNLVVPLVGDFAGPKAIRAVGDYLRAQGAIVSVVYTSNVEQYLFQQGDDWSRYYTNVGTLPLDSTSSFIRSLSNRGWVSNQNPNSRSAQLVGSISELLAAFRAGKISQYYDVIMLSHQ
jgi:hypothetical protein